MSAAIQYKAKARDLMPEHLHTLTDGITDDMSLGTIDDIIFQRSEYLGGMCAVLISLVKNSQPDSAS
ncbi:hypothetical protein [uncultured Paraglaciecola sp.]|uniref:hypothetical protein n=1 Tax=uncultured Paraglaciecola sp. TaxID=1765024 RepID=UPI002606BAC6|nr:hypothetical protein [uncultured Paraglaciecola sp.]